MTTDLIPAAEYLRMSTEHQQYSLENQSAAIRRYAKEKGFTVIRVYSDAARSGVALKGREGLRKLLLDVASGKADYRAILVFDVSRWGRFQDADEAAHYEFLCKLAGIPVHYCAEAFTNDGTVPSLMMKALKRMMAGEYSRELGAKVLAGQKRLAAMGFKQGGRAGYGLRRLLVSVDREPKQELAPGERKSIASDRVILVPGPPAEIHTVREIYRMFVSEGMSTDAIARELNRRGIAFTEKSKWNHYAVNSVLTRPKYCGRCAFNRTSSRLFTPKIRLAKSEWVVAGGAFEPVVTPEIFDAAQKRLECRTANKSNEQLLEDLKALFIANGRLSIRVIENSPDVAAASTYAVRFGSIRRAYELIGYGSPVQFDSLDLRTKVQTLRRELLERIVSSSIGQFSIARTSGRFRAMLQCKDGLTLSVLISSCRTTLLGSSSWRIDPVPRESNHVTLLARLDQANLKFMDFYLFPTIDKTKQFMVTKNDWWLDHGVRLNDLCDLRAALGRLADAMKVHTNRQS